MLFAKISRFLVVYWFTSSAIFANCFVLEHQDKQRKLSISELRNLKGMYTTQFIKDPHVSKKPIQFEGVHLHKLLSHHFGDKWSQNQSLVFEASDGYKVEVETNVIATYQPQLSFGIIGQQEFNFADELQQGKIQELGPLYLVWDLARFPKLQEEGSTQNWPYQIVRITLRKNTKVTSELVPEGKHNEKAPIWLGYENYKKYCFTCHTLSENNPHNAPSSQKVFEMLKVRDLVWLEKFLSNPRAWTPSSSMPSLDIPKQTIKNIKLYSEKQASKPRISCR